MFQATLELKKGNECCRGTWATASRPSTKAFEFVARRQLTIYL